MPTKERLRAIGTARARHLIRNLGDELRNARLAAGLSQARVAAAAGTSQPMISRYEAGHTTSLDLVHVARHAAVVGLDLRVQLFPNGGQLRDAAHAALISRFLARLPRSIRRVLEAPIQRNDLRAWDVLLIVGGIRIGVIAETRIRDLQALLRREQQKQLDSSVDLLILLVADTRHNRATLASATHLLAEIFPVSTRAVLSALGGGEAPTANGVVLL